MDVKNQYFKILEYFLRSIKQRIWVSLKYVHLCTQYLVGAPLAQIPASVRCCMEAISLCHCWGTVEPSACLDCWIDLSHISLENIPYIPYGFQVRHVGWLIKHSNIMSAKNLEVIWHCGQVLKTCWKRKSASPYSLSVDGSLSALKSPARWLHWLWTW